jgi:hypothetical protein
MLAFESLTPAELLKEVAEYIRMEALRRSTEVTILDRKSRLTRAEKDKRARHESADNALRSIAQDLEGARIIPAGSVLRTGSFRRRYTETHEPEGENFNCNGSGPHTTGEVRKLAHGKDPHHGNSILCRACFQHELEHRRDRNRTLEAFAQFDLPRWEDAEVYEV